MAIEERILKPGDALAGWRIASLLHEGGMARLYAVETPASPPSCSLHTHRSAQR